MSNNNTERSDDSELSRRGVVQALGTAGLVTGLAGCGGRRAANTSSSSNGGGGGGTNSGTPGTTQPDKETVQNEGKPMDAALTVAQWAVPKDSQYNPWNGKSYAEPRRMLFDRLMRHNLKEQKFYGYAVSDWSFDGKTVSLKLRDGLTWHDGDDVTATDLANQLKLDMYTGGSLKNYVDEISSGVEVADKRTVKLDLKRTVNKQIVLSYLQPKRLVGKDSVYGSYVKKLDNAGSDNARSDVLAKLQNKSISKPVGNGPFQFEDADSQRTLLTKYGKHPDAGKINFPKMEYLYMPTNQKRWDALINDQTDGSATLFMPQNKLNQLPDHDRVGLIPRHWGMGLVFNYSKDHVGDPNVRKALAYVINRDAVAKNSAAGTGSKLGVDIPSGLTGQFSGSIKKKWLKGVVDKFDKYETNTDKAASLLKDSGYTKKKGTWVDSDGNKLSIPIKGPSGFTDWVAGAKTAVSQLQDFGIDASLHALDTNTYWGKDYSNGDFVVGLQGWADYDNSYPYFHFDFIYNSTDSEQYWQVPKQLKAPPLSNPSGSPQTFTPGEMVTKLSKSSGGDATQQIQELAFLTNQTLPVLPLMEKLAQTYLTSDDWNVPPKNSPKLQQYWPTEWLPRMGAWSAKRK